MNKNVHCIDIRTKKTEQKIEIREKKEIKNHLRYRKKNI